MCGIFGFVGRSSWKTSLLLQSLCITGEVRGRHSTGIVIQSDRCYLKKKSLRGREFVAERHADFLFRKKYGVALGHNRYATAGMVNDRNAHPFGVRVNGGWNFGIHNGIAGNKTGIARKYNIAESSVQMQNRGIDTVDAINNITEFISCDADFAFAYLNTSERAVYLWRSPERPLVIFDARRLWLGRWFSSTKEIFGNAWDLLAGAMGNLKKVTFFEAMPYRLYRCADDGVYEVEPVRDLEYRSRVSVQHSLWEDEIIRYD
jgi:predicted glutamine amidotransferase